MQYNSTFATKIMLNRQNNVANVSFYLKKKEKTSFWEMRTELFGMIPLRSFLQKRQSEAVNRQNNVANDNFSCVLSLECDIYTDNSLRKRSVPVQIDPECFRNFDELRCNQVSDVNREKEKPARASPDE